MNKKALYVSITLWSVSFVWIAFIFANSLQTGSESGEMSGSVSRFINQLLSLIHPSLKLSHLFIRKMAHFSEFALLATLLCFAIRSRCRAQGREVCRAEWVLLALPFSVIVAACDETIQLFTDGRSGSAVDVLIDSAGAACATLIFFLALCLTEKSRNKKSSDTDT